jgi:2,3-bisphosphoglycerate-independent phosphoglycerate mutase
MKAPTILIIADGLGIAGESAGNAVWAANTPVLDHFREEYAYTTLAASGSDAGLPPGQCGNSETGHLLIGAGRVVPQSLTRVSDAITDGSFFRNAAYMRAIENCLSSGSALHLIGLLSDGGVYSHTDHLFALLRMARNHGLKRVWIHAFLDGRTAPPTSGADFLRRTESVCRELDTGAIATVMGRRFGMDRQERWDLIEEAYDALVYGEGTDIDPNPAEAVERLYRGGITDEFIEPIVCDSGGTVSDHDSVIFFNCGGSRLQELAQALTSPTFNAFTRQVFPLVCVSTGECGVPEVEVAFRRPELRNTLGEYLSGLGLTQLRMGEEERIRRVTVLFNGGRETPFPGEERFSVPSLYGPDAAVHPEKSAEDLSAEAIARMEAGTYDMIVLTLSDCDKAGHSGDFKATVRAVETVDECIGRVVEAALKLGGIAMVTGSHGNAEDMLLDNGSPRTSGTMNPVPFLLCGAGTRLRPGRLSDIAPTVLDVMGLACPPEMDGKTLIVE